MKGQLEDEGKVNVVLDMDTMELTYDEPHYEEVTVENDESVVLPPAP